MSKTPDEIKKGLECCDEQMNCDGCPYHGEDDCSYLILKEGLSYIRQLEERNKSLRENNDKLLALDGELHRDYLEQRERADRLEAERDAAVACLKKAANEKGECFGCKWYNGKNCTHPDYKMLCSSHDDKWQWRGVQKEDTP